jgi:hypothetical protein
MVTDVSNINKVLSLAEMKPKFVSRKIHRPRIRPWHLLAGTNENHKISEWPVMG